ncbi:MAG: S8 family serine peptidase, partial [Chloroflexi bacterium]|nr:S8 family serine peptidase [Chloroflexota bacterium]
MEVIMMLHRVRFLKALGILLTLLGLLVGASYAQEPETYHDAPGQAVIHLQPGVDVFDDDDGTRPPTGTPELMEMPEPTATGLAIWTPTSVATDTATNLKASAIRFLEEIPEPQDPWLVDRVAKAIEHINKSLQPDLWYTDSSLTKKGKKVFDEEKKAVKELMKVLEKADIDQGVTDAASLAIDGLITADQVLASTAITQTIENATEAGCYDNRNDDAECQKVLREIARAEEEMDKAKEEIVKDKYDKAIDHYKKAWEHAQDDEHTFYGFVESPMPQDGFIGTWMVSGKSFVATADTKFKEKHGDLEVDAYVKVKYYVSGGISYATQIETKKSHVAGQVIARLKPAADVAGIHNDYNALTLGRLLDRVYLLSLQPGTNEQDTVDNMRNDARIEYAEPNLFGEAPEADGYEMFAWAGYDPAPGMDQYANEHLDLPLARELSTGSGMVVAVLDTGVQLDHPALAPHLVAGYDFIDDDTVPSDEGNGLDDDGDELIDETVGHGTHVAGIVLLVAPQSQI